MDEIFTGHSDGDIAQFGDKMRYVTITVTGKDLMRYGLKPGPIFREIMQRVLDAKLDGLLKTRDDELRFVGNHLTTKNAKHF